MNGTSEALPSEKRKVGRGFWRGKRAEVHHHYHVLALDGVVFDDVERGVLD